ncbi:hypothetical protein DIPPA_06268 [Diplonema papillatum]|nr:hypothetical protein DIPPA_06268 [Diplonema papillatum]
MPQRGPDNDGSTSEPPSAEGEEVAHLEAQLNIMAEEVAAAEQRRDEAEDRARRLEMMLAALSDDEKKLAKMKELRDSLSERERQVASLHAQLESATVSHKSRELLLLNENDSLRAEVNQLTAALSRSKAAMIGIPPAGGGRGVVNTSSPSQSVSPQRSFASHSTALMLPKRESVRRERTKDTFDDFLLNAEAAVAKADLLMAHGS